MARVVVFFLVLFSPFVFSAELVGLQAFGLQRQLQPYLRNYRPKDGFGDSLFRLSVSSGTLNFDEWADGRVTRHFSAALKDLPRMDLKSAVVADVGLWIRMSDPFRERFGFGSIPTTHHTLMFTKVGSAIRFVQFRDGQVDSSKVTEPLIPFSLEQDDDARDNIWAEISAYQQGRREGVSPADFLAGAYSCERALEPAE